MNWSVLLQNISIGIITSVAVITILKQFFNWRNRPQFSVEFKQSDPFCRVTWTSDFVHVSQIISTYWIRLEVNNKGKSTAKYCLGKLMKVMNDKGEYIKEYDPMRLHWDSTAWKETPFATVDLSRDELACLDTLVVQNKTVFLAGDQHPWSKYEQRAIPKSLASGMYILQITVYGNEVKPVTKYLSVIVPDGELLNKANETTVKVALSDCLQDAKTSFGK